MTGWMAANSNADEKTGWILAIEDAGRQTAEAMEADGRLADVGRVAFVRLKGKDETGVLGREREATQVFESALLSAKTRFSWTTHESHEEEWRLIDGVFDQAADFGDYDPATHPELGKLALADALLIGQVVNAASETRTETTERQVQVAMRLIRISTGEDAWGALITGRATEEHTRADALKEEALGWLTWKNAGIALAVLVGLLVLRGLVRAMTRVR